MSAIHYMPVVNWGGGASPTLCGTVGGSATNKVSSVTCADCNRLLAKPEVKRDPEHLLVNLPGGGIVYLCGVERAAAASVDPMHVTCSDCLHILASRRRGSGSRPPKLHKPPMMDERGTGIFEFYDVDYQHPMEVVPQSPSGNVEITLGDTLFTLHHLDRADLIRALLHDFHYSPERGGPTDE